MTAGCVVHSFSVWIVYKVFCFDEHMKFQDQSSTQDTLYSRLEGSISLLVLNPGGAVSGILCVSPITELLQASWFLTSTNALFFSLSCIHWQTNDVCRWLTVCWINVFCCSFLTICLLFFLDTSVCGLSVATCRPYCITAEIWLYWSTVVKLLVCIDHLIMDQLIWEAIKQWWVFMGAMIGICQYFWHLCMRAYIVLRASTSIFLNKMNSRLRAVNQAWINVAWDRWGS